MRAVLLFSVVAVSGLLSVGITRGDDTQTLGYYSVDACDIDCETGCSMGGGQTGHTANHGFGEGGVYHDPCWAGGTCEAHKCGGGDTFLHPELKLEPTLRREYVEDLEATTVAAASGSVEAAIELITNYPEHVEYNSERRALQVRGCAADVMAGNIPLTDAQAAAVAAGL